jgi:hypothetical protein
MEDFPWTFDQLQRYSVLRELIEVFYPNPPSYPEKSIRILDIGGRSPDREGSHFWLPVKRVFTGQSFALDINFCNEKGFIQGDGTQLPFRDASFNVVAALDVIEHIPDEKREEFLKEMCRVTKASVVVSAPFHDENIDRTEDALQKQLKCLYGATHEQLKEHKEKGLPDASDITQALRRLLPSGVDFSYGSLSNWLSLQAIKNCFMFKRNSGKIQALLDNWMASVSSISESEFKPPFSRHYWLSTRDMGQEELEKGVEVLKKRLKDKKINELYFPEHLSLPKEIVEFFCGDRVSALVVAENGQNLKECLNHLLTQDFSLDLEVVVWDLGKSKEAEKIVLENFPALKCWKPDDEGKADNELLKILTKLQGNFLLLLSENTLLPKESVHNLYERLKGTSESTLLAPRAVGGEHAYGVWIGGKYSLFRMAAGRISNIFWRLKKQNPAWIYSECLFFRREALIQKKLSSNHIKKRNIFLWGKAAHSAQWIYAPEIVVYKK